MVEHAAVNRRVVGSSPTRGAKTKPQIFVWGFVVLSVDYPAEVGTRVAMIPDVRILFAIRFFIPVHSAF